MNCNLSTLSTMNLSSLEIYTNLKCQICMIKNQSVMNKNKLFKFKRCKVKVIFKVKKYYIDKNIFCFKKLTDDQPEVGDEGVIDKIIM